MNIINIPYISYKRGRDILIKEDLPRARAAVAWYRILCDAFIGLVGFAVVVVVTEWMSGTPVVVSGFSSIAIAIGSPVSAIIILLVAWPFQYQ